MITLVHCSVFLFHPLLSIFFFFFFNDTATTEIYTLSLHDALPIWSRSGLSTRHNIEVGAGWIDPDYRGELKIELKNFSNRDFVVEEGMRIAQLLVLPFASPEVEVTDELPRSVRGAGGFGSTGLR